MRCHLIRNVRWRLATLTTTVTLTPVLLACVKNVVYCYLQYLTVISLWLSALDAVCREKAATSDCILHFCYPEGDPSWWWRDVTDASRAE